MLVLTWVMNSTTVAAIQLFLLNELVNQSRMHKLVGIKWLSFDAELCLLRQSLTEV